MIGSELYDGRAQSGAIRGFLYDLGWIVRVRFERQVVQRKFTPCTRPVKMMAVIKGPSSRTMEMLTTPATTQQTQVSEGA